MVKPVTRESVDNNRAAKNRTRALTLGIATGLGSRVLTLAAPLLTIPVTLDYLGPDVFGFWMVITSITAMAMFADMGLGNGLLTKLGPSAARGDHASAKSYISAAYFSLGAISLLLLVLCWVAIPLVNWSQVFTVGPVETQELRMVAVFGFTAFALSIPLSLVQRVQYAFQEAWQSNIWQVGAALVTVISIYGTVLLDLGSSAVIGVAVFSSPLVLAVNNIVYYSRRPNLAPKYRAVSRQVTNELLGLGISFLALSITVSVSLNADNMIVGRLADLETVSAFAIATKLFSLLSLAVTFVALPLWPANSEALARGDVAWVSRMTLIMVVLSAATVAILGAGLLVVRNVAAELWLGNGHHIPFELAAALVVWSVIVASAAPLFSVQNSVGIIHYQLTGWVLFALASIPLKIFLYGKIQLPGVIVASIICYTAFVLPSALIGYKAAVISAPAINVGD